MVSHGAIHNILISNVDNYDNWTNWLINTGNRVV